MPNLKLRRTDKLSNNSYTKWKRSKRRYIPHPNPQETSESQDSAESVRRKLNRKFRQANKAIQNIDKQDDVTMVQTFSKTSKETFTKKK